MDCCLGINRSDIGHEIVRLLKEKGGHYNENLDVLMDGNFRLRYGHTYSKDTFDRKAFVRKFEVASGRNLDDQYLHAQFLGDGRGHGARPRNAKLYQKHGHYGRFADGECTGYR